MKYAAQKL